MPKVHVFARDHINTDEIIPARHLTTDVESELAKYAMEDYDKDFVRRVEPGDIIVAGADFGCGSSREHAVWALRGAGVAAVIAPNFARIYYRNSINNGFLALECDGIVEAFQDGDPADLDLKGGTITNTRTGQQLTFVPVPQFALDVQKAGGWLEYMKANDQAALEAETLNAHSTQAGHGHPGQEEQHA
ncbi:3-isopropylmalate dehydratase small subunit [Deinococcus soli (ex Cha et al. 2016)]|uniref:3-isopropylmalate dehydratase small subunit n=1 Tax=Deinococcus soli (ex Cha et al. 2016) TaxID=1309411 RepID=A0A0F7JNN7_9DEIO|nr:3-isopropylmalate dehydratase small subunit [Deinococcus soli (ex Cha et al. 2016)]AKH16225.1 3-isopropylmalate dehydratase [Deinococcus soli (ex Cha et al. 2016)]